MTRRRTAISVRIRSTVVSSAIVSSAVGVVPTLVPTVWCSLTDKQTDR